MPNAAKNTDKLNQHIIALEKERRDVLTNKKNNSAKVSHADIQKKIETTRSEIDNLQKQK